MLSNEFIDYFSFENHYYRFKRFSLIENSRINYFNKTFSRNYRTNRI